MAGLRAARACRFAIERASVASIFSHSATGRARGALVQCEPQAESRRRPSPEEAVRRGATRATVRSLRQNFEAGCESRD
jgi:hypothetical protein